MCFCLSLVFRYGDKRRLGGKSERPWRFGEKFKAQHNRGKGKTAETQSFLKQQPLSIRWRPDSSKIPNIGIATGRLSYSISLTQLGGNVSLLSLTVSPESLELLSQCFSDRLIKNPCRSTDVGVLRKGNYSLHCIPASIAAKSALQRVVSTMSGLCATRYVRDLHFESLKA